MLIVGSWVRHHADLPCVGERLADIGLKSAGELDMRTFDHRRLEVWATQLFSSPCIFRKSQAGFRRDLSKFKDVQGIWNSTMYGVFVRVDRRRLLRGIHRFVDFLDCRVWRCSFGRQVAALGSGACIRARGRCSEQRTLTRIRSASRSPAQLGILMGLLVLASGRNLWAVIIGHGLFDASRFVLFYFQGPPT